MQIQHFPIFANIHTFIADIAWAAFDWCTSDNDNDDSGEKIWI